MKDQSQNGPDIVALITKMQEQLAALNKKVDILVSKSSSRPVEVKPAPQSLTNPSPKSSFNQPVVHAHDPIPGIVRTQPQVQPQTKPQSQRQQQGRLMHQATCADCQKTCEIPFKPTGERPVYCKECFLQRKNKTGNAVNKVAAEQKAPEALSVQVVVPAAVPAAVPVQEEPAALVKEKARKKPVSAKKPVAKKPAAKKKPIVAKKK